MQVTSEEQVLDRGITLQNLTFPCNDGILLTGQIWRKSFGMRQIKNSERVRILCLHGFLDNCRSYHTLAPVLFTGISERHPQHKDVELVAMDFPGHGKSSHKSMDHPPYSMVNDIIYYVAQVVDILQWDRFIMVGHSMGAMASIKFTGTFPECVQQLVLLDGFGPDFERPNRVVKRLRQHILARYDGNTRPKEKKLYRSIEDATQTRMNAARKCPGNQWLSKETAQEMVVWALEKVEGGYHFSHDPRLHWPALQSHTLEQAFDFWKGIRAGNVPTLWLRAQDGWPFSKKWLDRAEDYLGSLATVLTLPGSHHFHADPDTVDTVAATILDHLIVLNSG